MQMQLTVFSFSFSACLDSDAVSFSACLDADAVKLNLVLTYS